MSRPGAHPPRTRQLSPVTSVAKPRGRATQGLRAGWLAAVAVVALAACGGSTAPGNMVKNGDDTVRTDLDPLTTRFSALGEPESAAWMSGTLGGDAVGPSTYWIDAVVRLAPDTEADLRALTTDPQAQTPAVVDALQEEVPAGVLLRSDGLDDAFTENGFTAHAYLARDEPVLVLVALGQ